MSDTATIQETPTTETPISTPRTSSLVLEEYKQCAALVGDKCYRLKLLEAELDGLYKKMYELNSEHIKFSQTAPVPPTLVNTQPAS